MQRQGMMGLSGALFMGVSALAASHFAAHPYLSAVQFACAGYNLGVVIYLASIKD